MPTYEFRCPQGHDFEKLYRTISGAEAQAACPVCGQPAERIMSATGFAFKGSGFYLTDYGRNAHRDKGTEPRTKTAESSAGSDAAKVDGAKADGAKSDGAKSESKGETVKSADTSGGSAAPKPEPKAAEKKPVAAPKQSSGE